jgi:hypothetical protein
MTARASAPPSPDRRRVGQLTRLLSSDQPGEAAAAAQPLTRTLASAGLDIHELAEVAEAGLLEADKRPSLAQPVEAPPRAPTRRPEPPLKLSETLICDAEAGIFRPCSCGAIPFLVEPGVGPQSAKLVCASCGGGGGRWPARRYFEAAP